MNDYTYERENSTEKLETYEWDNIWFEQTHSNTPKRVLYLGDSISCGIRRIATKLSHGKYLFDGIGTSKSLDNPFLPQTISLFAQQEGKREVVLFNNGLHGFHLSNDEYAKYYQKIIEFLIAEFHNSQIAVVLTTFTEQEEPRKKIVYQRNIAAKKIANKFNLPIIDLYTVSMANKKQLAGDGIHLTDEGYGILAKEILRVLDEITSSVSC